MIPFEKLRTAFKESVNTNQFVKLTLSKPIRRSEALQNVYVCQILLKNTIHFQFTYRNKTNDYVKNYNFDEAVTTLEALLSEHFRACVLFTLANDLHVLVSKKRNVHYRITKPTFANKLPDHHNHQKEQPVTTEQPYLYHLGVTDKQNQIIPKMASKYRQINKYLEIMENLLNTVDTTQPIHIVDMGSGKGYLTFALYDYLVNIKKYDAQVTGIELRDNLVKQCNDTAKKCDFTNLYFVSQRIKDFHHPNIDVLIALHACDTATDDAIYKGLVANATLIVCAPCCHKQIRQQVKGKEQESPLLKYGIFKERQFEMVTDTIRALILEKHSYNTKVFEFISNEHTRKNIMLVGSKSSKNKNIKSITHKINTLKAQYHIDEHYLERILKNKN